MTIRTVIVDDELHAREGIRLRLKDYPEVEVAGECGSGTEAVSMIERLHPDLLFLDIQMPEMNGFEVLQKLSLSRPPIVIFVTAYDTFAIRAFECHALDYLLKPIRDDRFKESLRVVIAEANRRNLEHYVGKLKAAVADYLETGKDGARTDIPSENPAARPYLTRLMVKERQEISMIPVDSIEWIESAGDYVYVHSRSQKHLVRETLTSLEERLNPAKFVRIHRTAIANIEQIKLLKPNEHGDYDVLMHSGMKLKLSRTYRARFEEATGNTI
jgi:two-component system LytT family response regulator